MGNRKLGIWARAIAINSATPGHSAARDPQLTPYSGVFCLQVLAAQDFAHIKVIQQPRKLVEMKILAGGKIICEGIYPVNHADFSACCRPSDSPPLSPLQPHGCPISTVEIAACAFPAKSAVRAPFDSTLETAFSMQTASASN